MKHKFLVFLFSFIFGIMIGISIPHAIANPMNMNMNAPEVMELQSGTAASGNINWSSMMVNGKKVVVFTAVSDSGCIDIELFW